MIKTVDDLLKPLNLPTLWELTPDMKKSDIGISYHFFNEGNLSYGDGADNEAGGALQVDIYSKVDYTNTVIDIKGLLKEGGFRFYEGRDSLEQLDNNTNLYHKILIFNYIESEVKK